MSTATLEPPVEMKVPLKTAKAIEMIEKITIKLKAGDPINPWAALSIKGKGTAIKTSIPNLIIRKGVMAPREAAWLRDFKAKSNCWEYSWYILGRDMWQTPVKKRPLEILVPEKWYPSGISNGDWLADMVVHMTPEVYISTNFLTRNASAISMPDESGKCTVWAHVSSIWTQRHLPTLYKPNDGLNRDMLPSLTDWKQLAKYINSVQKADQRVVCDIVKSISRNEAAVELDAMIQEARG